LLKIITTHNNISIKYIKSSLKINKNGTGKGDGIPLVYGKDGLRIVKGWWRDWQVGMSVANGDLPKRDLK
jgi:hypothetical protein